MDACGGLQLVFSGDGEEKVIDVEAEYKDIFTNTSMYKLTQDDVQIQYRQRLGSGAFCNVYPCFVKNGRTKEFNERLPPFAIKMLNYELAENPQLLQAAFDDICHEAEIMRKLSHENITSMYGMCDLEIGKKNMTDFFIVTEKLEGTLGGKLEKWAKIRGSFKKFVPADSVELRINLVAKPLAEAFRYIHSQNIIYRDLKPGNIGFDAQGNVKLFDFGLAVVIEKENGFIRGKAGTLRYMAPEMKAEKGRGQYSFTADVYSYAILLWEIVASRIPFEKEIPMSQFSPPKELPIDKRPNLKYIESADLGNLLVKAWESDPMRRLTFEQLIPELELVSKYFQAEREKSDKKKKPSKKIFGSVMNNY